MAYGMRSSELAAVGQNVNKQGQGVSEDSIQAALDQELTQERKETVARNKERASKAKAADAQQKAQLKSNLVKAVVDSAIQVGGAMASSPKAQAKQADRAATRSAKKVSRLETKSAKLVADPNVSAKKVENVGTRLGRAKQQHAGAQFRAQEAYQKAYGKPGALYGKKPTVVQPDTPELPDDSVITI